MRKADGRRFGVLTLRLDAAYCLLVLAVNVVASAAAALFSTSAAGLLLALGVLAFAVDIAAFAVAQGLALRRLGAARARG